MQQKDVEYAKQQLRSESEYQTRRSDDCLQGFDEYHDGVTLQISVGVSDTSFLQQIQNAIRVSARSLPRGRR